MNWRLPAVRRRRNRDERGYFSILTIIMFVTLFGLAAFAVDVGNWYLTGQKAQRAADAAALAGVPSLPGSKVNAFAAAQAFATANGFKNGVQTVTVVPGIDGTPTRLRVTVSKTVDNVFGGLFGLEHTTITRTAVADYAGPVPMGSPCNTFGNDPDPGTFRGTTCGGVNGQLWANVNSPSSSKTNGDAYQSAKCTTEDLCTSGVNTEYQTNGYYYSLLLRQPVSNLVLQVYDGSFVDVGLQCPTDADSGKTVFGTGTTEALDARNDWITDETTRYVSGSASAYCTGDSTYATVSGNPQMKTQFTLRDPSVQTWDPTTFQPHPGCQKTYGGFTGKLYNALNKTSTATYRDDIAQTFRRWDTICTIPYAPAGEYLVQVKTNGLGVDNADQGNRFALRAYSSSSSASKESISFSAREKMGIFSNKPAATTEFYLARVPSGSGGQILTVKLFDVGDTSTSVTGTIQVIAPPDSGVTFTNCKGTGVTNSTLATCSFNVTGSSSGSAYNGKNQYVSIPIPTAYTCVDTDYTKCWVRLKYIYGTGAAPQDVTSWEASIEGDPVRLVE